MILMDFSYFFLLFSGFFGWVWGAVLGISAVSATFFCSFPDFGLGFGVLFGEFLRFQLLFPALFRIFGGVLGCCFGNFCGFSYFFLLFSGFLAGFGVLFWEFLRFQLLFPAFFRLFGRVWGAVLGIFAVSAPQSPLAMLSTYGYCTL